MSSPGPGVHHDDLVPYQGTEPTPTTLALTGLEFEHPAEIGEAWKEMNCKDCYAGQ
jgi:hypothetical protein